MPFDVEAFEAAENERRFGLGGAEIEPSVTAELMQKAGMNPRQIEQSRADMMRSIAQQCMQRARAIRGETRLVMNFIARGMKSYESGANIAEIALLHELDVLRVVESVVKFQRNQGDVSGLPDIERLVKYQVTEEDLRPFGLSFDDIDRMRTVASEEKLQRMLSDWRQEKTNLRRLMVIQLVLQHDMKNLFMHMTPAEEHEIFA